MDASLELTRPSGPSMVRNIPIIDLQLGDCEKTEVSEPARDPQKFKSILHETRAVDMKGQGVMHEVDSDRAKKEDHCRNQQSAFIAADNTMKTQKDCDRHEAVGGIKAFALNPEITRPNGFMQHQRVVQRE